MLAVDKIMSPQPFEEGTAASAEDKERGNSSCRAAFVIGRPPGHHAGPQGCVPSDSYWQKPDMVSSGFCLLNTVAVAAVCLLLLERHLPTLTSQLSS